MERSYAWATLNFQEPEVELVVSKRDASGTDLGLEGARWDARAVTIENAREFSTQPTLDVEGFELRASNLEALAIDFYDDLDIIGRYYAECEHLVREAFGGAPATVKAFDHNVRSAEGFEHGRRLKGGNAVQKPVGFTHTDYTPVSAPRRLEMLAQPPKQNDALRTTLGADGTLLSEDDIAGMRSGDRRYGIVNVWRSILVEPVQAFPLACCDARTTSREDLLVFQIKYVDRTGENHFVRHSAKQRWVYYDAMERTEALLLKQWDSAGVLAGDTGGASEDETAQPSPATFALHSAFIDPTSPEEGAVRESIEVRCAVIF